MTYAIKAGTVFPKRWTDKDGKPIVVMAGPTKGWLMVRRPGCIPFVLRLGELLNWDKHQHPYGPFKVVETKKRGRA